MTKNQGIEGSPAAPEGRPEPFRPATFYDLRLIISKLHQKPHQWSAHLEDQQPGGWKSETHISTTVTGAIARAFAECVEALSAHDPDPKSRKNEEAP